MITPNLDDRSIERRAQDNAIAAEPLLTPPELPADAVPLPVDVYLARLQRPVAVAGIVENGVVRPLDTSIKLPERTRVIIVTSE